MSYLIVGLLGFVIGLVAAYFIDIYVFVNKIIEKIKAVIATIRN